MKVRMFMGEDYPVFGISGDERLPEIEVPDEMATKWNEVEAQWQKCQLEMSDFYYLSYPEIW